MKTKEKFNADIHAQVVSRREQSRANLRASMKSSCADHKLRVDNHDKRQGGDV